LIFGVMGVAGWFVCCCGIHWLCDKLKCIDDYKEQFGALVKSCSGRMEQTIGIKADQIENIILERVNIFIDDIQVKIVPGIMNQSLAYLKTGIAVVSFFVVMIIAAILIIKDFEVMKAKMMQLGGYQEVVSMFRKMCNLILSFFKAQVLILVVVAAICIVGFYFAGNRAFWILGIVTGLLDVLPFVGTGITLLPYMFWKYVNEDVVSGTILLVTFLVSALARELLEPRLIGKKMNILPVLILVSVYAGIKVFGITGVFLGPLYVMMISEAIHKIYKKKPA
ncbi:MAG: AI-2E family transporter, partial [Lachnospiraceae bacterium]|nr:AI-2E family transporter [Lachnospiraceae bacterium]